MEFVVTTINIDCLSMNRPSMYSWENRKKVYYEYTRNVVNDIMCFQEACEDNISYICSVQMNMKIFKGLGIRNREGVTTYNPIMWNSSFEMLKSGSFYLPYTQEYGGDASELRSVTWVILKCIMNNSRVIILNTHLDNKGIIARKKSIKDILSFLCNLTQKECCPVIVTGDFNSRPWFPVDEDQNVYGKLIRPGYLPTDHCYEEFDRYGFEDSYFLDGSRHTVDSNTYHDYCGEVFPKVALRLDWQLFLRKQYSNIYCCSYDVLKEYIFSDHYPVSCKYNIEPTIFDCLYSGYNKAFSYCSQGYALKRIGGYLEEKYSDNLEFIKRVIMSENYLKYTLGECNIGYDYPCNNAVIQNGVIKEVDNKFIVKYFNLNKKNALYKEIKNYKKLKEVFPHKYFLGILNNKKVYFDIVPPINIESFEKDGCSIMNKLNGVSFENMIYSYEKINFKLLEYYVQIIRILFDNGFVCVDMSPRNIILLQTEDEVRYQLIDFEKSYFISKEKLLFLKPRIMRGQLCGEELAVLLDMDVIKKLFGTEYNPDEWDMSDATILMEPYRPEIHNILIGRSKSEYSVGVYNKVEKEVLDVVKPNRCAKYEELRFPGRIKYKVEHYFNCLSVGDGEDYERKVTELLIRARKISYSCYERLVFYFAESIGMVEEQILCDYSIYGDFFESKRLAILLAENIDGLFKSEKDMLLTVGDQL